MTLTSFHCIAIQNCRHCLAEADSGQESHPPLRSSTVSHSGPSPVGDRRSSYSPKNAHCTPVAVLSIFSYSRPAAGFSEVAAISPRPETAATGNCDKTLLHPSWR